MNEEIRREESFVKTQENENKKNSLWELVRVVLLAVIIVLPIRLFIAQPFIVSGTSMVPTFHDSEYLIVDEISYRLDEPKRGEVIVFRFPHNPSVFYIKRVIGLPGETINIEKGVVTIKNEENPDGTELEEPYVSAVVDDGRDMSVELKENEYFVMGDNRPASSDSRSWGPLEEDFIVGRALVRVLPFEEFGIFPGFFSY
ncbi:MAG: signal peptidase I [Candidatus Pacebacteria bacterium]|nr:signal peptidase I [Candidatus Paceibacterota bacterium]MBP9058100.1 signal peptidase I [Candidatus Paceibacterota bacterium]MBP9769994.1 signal peptidase I [Candidatus Paceibacterota bacterium]